MRGSILVLCTCLLFTAQCFYIDEWLTENKEEALKEGGNIWVLIVAGSNGWYNYRHQSDISHLYHILTKKHGIPPEFIVNMQYNDIAYNENNPHPGIIINALHGEDVYEGNMIDYMGRTVTATNFLKILKGHHVSGGSGKVINSKSNDVVFVNFADHGGPGLLAFPDDELHVADLTRILKELHEARKYKQMLWYVEACYAGSMFADSLTADMNITAHTAANADESSYACVLDEDMDVYLGDCWSLNWMNNTEQIFPRLYSETVGQQYDIVKKMTTESHASIYGDMQVIYNEPISTFLGHGPKPATATPPVTLTAEEMYKTSIQTPDIMLDYLRRKRAKTDDENEAQELDIQIQYHEVTEEKVQVVLDKIAIDVTGSIETAYLTKKEAVRIDDAICNKAALDTFFGACYRSQTHPYILKYVSTLTKLCNRYQTEDIVKSVLKYCTVNN